MITKVKSFQTSDGSTHPTLAEAQDQEILNLFDPSTGKLSDQQEHVIEFIRTHHAALAEILSVKERKPRSKPAVTRTRKPATTPAKQEAA